jgi:hypothetical protein
MIARTLRAGAVAAHDAAVRRWAGEVIALLHSARVIEDSCQNRIA